MGSLVTLHDLTDTLAFDLDKAPEEFIRTAGALLRARQLKQCRGEPILDMRARVLTELPLGPAPFIEYVFRHERTGEPIQNAAFHERWQDFFAQNDYGVILAPVGHGKTQQLLGRVLWELGRDPTLRIAIICATDDQAVKRVSQLRTMLRDNPRIREVFPDLAIDPQAKLTEHEFSVEGRPDAKDPSIRAYGMGSSALQGARLDIVLLDDVCDRDNTNTVELRAKMTEWFDAIVFQRRTPGERYRVWAIGTPWHYEDLLHVLAERPAFACERWSAVLNPDDPMDEWLVLWDEQNTVADLRFLWENTTPHAFARKQLCQVRDESHARFQMEWIRKCLALGKGRTLLDQPPVPYAGGPLLPCITGVDLGVGQDEEHDLSVLFTIAVMPDRKRLIVDIQSGRWTAPEIVQRIIRTARRYRSIVVVESNAAQDFIRQWAEDLDDLPIEPHNTGRNKRDEDFGIETLGVELRAGRWILPSNAAGEAEDTEIKLLIRGMRNYKPKDHTPDHLVAMWIARERARDMGAGEGAASAQDR